MTPLPYTHNENRTSLNMSSQAAHSPEPPGSATADGRPRPMEVNAHSQRNYFDIAGGDRFSQNFGLVQFWHDPDAPWTSLSKQNTNVRADDPRGRNQQLLGLPFGNEMLQNFSNFRDAVPSDCETIGPAALMSDSGYGSLPKASVGIPSHYGGDMERNLDAQSIAGRLSDIQLQNRLGQQRSTAQSQPEVERHICPFCNKQVKNRSELNKHHLRHTKPFSCQIAGCSRKQGFSTKNDLARHQESVHNTDGVKYNCNINACNNKNKTWPRADNFRQHLKRVHGLDLTADDERLQSFIHSPPQEAGLGFGPSVTSDMAVSPMPASNWAVMDPRHEDDVVSLGDASSRGEATHLGDDTQFSTPSPVLDERNFTHNLDQDSRGEEVHSLRTVPEDSLPFEHMSCIRPDDLKHTFSQDLNDGLDHRPEVIDLVSQESVSPDPSGYDADHSIDGPAVEHACKPAIEQSQDSGAMLDSRSQDEAPSPQNNNEPAAYMSQLPLDDDSFCVDITTPVRDESTTGEPTPAEAKFTANTHDFVNFDDDQASSFLQALKELGVLDKHLEQLGYQKAKETGGKPKKLQGSATHMKEKQIQCSKCTKVFSRKCELKKHLKRHDKPYGCTFHGCNKSFGSKNDWKRHENSQHFQLEVWKCEEEQKDYPTQICRKACHRRETFRHHLQKDHCISDPATIDKKLDTCRLGRNCQARFWCGFCEKKIEVKQKGLHAWAERFNHIDDHFVGRNSDKKDIKDWKHVDPDLPEMEDYTSSTDGTSRSGTPEVDKAGLEHGCVATVAAPGTLKKRSRDESLDHARHPKRIKGELWYCCHCQSQNSLEYQPRCFDCSHEYEACSNCETERPRGYDDDGENER